MQSLCTDEEIAITNIIEKIKDYHVICFLKTEATCALIQFYFNGKGQLTRAMPKSTLSGKDEKLQSLVSKILAYVI